MAVRPPIRVTLATNTWEAVVLPEEYRERHCQPCSFFTEDGTAFEYSPASDGAGAATVPAGKSLDIDCIFTDPDDGILLYAQAVAGTPVLVAQSAPNRER